MTKKLAVLLLAIVLLLTAARAEQNVDNATDYNYDFDADGYTGTWTEVPALNLEFCLPEGWNEADPGEDAAFAARRADGAASLTMRGEAGDVEDLAAWADSKLGAWEPAEAMFYDAAVVQGDGTLDVYILFGRTVIALAFDYSPQAALPLDYALQIAGSVSEIWTD